MVKAVLRQLTIKLSNGEGYNMTIYHANEIVHNRNMLMNLYIIETWACTMIIGKSTSTHPWQWQVSSKVLEAMVGYILPFFYVNENWNFGTHRTANEVHTHHQCFLVNKRGASDVPTDS